MTDTAPRGLAFVGCFTTERRRARGQGIDIYRTGRDLGDWTRLGRVENLTNPSFLVTDPARAILYTVQGDGEAASAFAVSPDGTLLGLGSAATGGRGSANSRGGEHARLQPGSGNHGQNRRHHLPLPPDLIEVSAARGTGAQVVAQP